MYKGPVYLREFCETKNYGKRERRKAVVIELIPTTLRTVANDEQRSPTFEKTTQTAVIKRCSNVDTSKKVSLKKGISRICRKPQAQQRE